MTYLPERDYFVRLVPLPEEVGGVVAPNEDGTYSIYINAGHSPERQRKSYRHEVRHITDGDFYSDSPIEDVENKKATA